MATFAVIEQMRLDDYVVIQTLEATDIGIGQSITLTSCDSTINGTHTVFAIPTGLFVGVSDEGDLQFNNDAIIRDRTVAKMSLDEWKAVLDVNLAGVFHCCKFGLEIMRDGGAIVSLGSISAITGFTLPGMIEEPG